MERVIDRARARQAMAVRSALFRLAGICPYDEQSRGRPHEEQAEPMPRDARVENGFPGGRSVVAGTAR